MRIRKFMIASCVLVAVGLIVTYRARAGVQQAAVATSAAQEARPAIPSAVAPVRTGERFVAPGVARFQGVPISTLTIAGAPLNPSEGDGATVLISGQAAQTPIEGFAIAVSEDDQLEAWVTQALSTYAQTEDQDARAKQRDEIAKGLNEIFDIRQEQRVNELKALEARVQKLRATLDQRAASKNEILKNRLDYLLREADGLGWGDGIPAPRRLGLPGAASAATFNTNPFGTTLRPDATSIDRVFLSPATPATPADVLAPPPANPVSPPVTY